MIPRFPLSHGSHLGTLCKGRHTVLPLVYQGLGSCSFTTLWFCWDLKFRTQGMYSKLAGSFVHDHCVFSRYIGWVSFLNRLRRKVSILACFCESLVEKPPSPCRQDKLCMSQGIQNQRTPLSQSPSGNAMSERQNFSPEGNLGVGVGVGGGPITGGDYHQNRGCFRSSMTQQVGLEEESGARN